MLDLQAETRSRGTPDCAGPPHAQAAAEAAEELLELIMGRYEHASTILTSSRPVEDWGKLLGDAAVTPPVSYA